MVALVLALTAAAAVRVLAAQPATGPPAPTRHLFYRQMAGELGAAGTRRVFGGRLATVAEYPAICALLDRYWRVRCSGAVLTRRWVVTAGHCVTPRVAYVKYDTSRPTSSTGRVAPVLYLYRHPKCVPSERSLGAVRSLRHRVARQVRGRVAGRGPRHRRDGAHRRRRAGARARRYRFTPPARLLRLDPDDAPLQPRRPARQGYQGSSSREARPAGAGRGRAGAERAPSVQVMGFGRTDDASMAEELLAVPLRMVLCERASWVHCVCGQARRQEGSTRGVCTGDSGGPVLYEGVQVAVTSMGPVECASRQGPPDAATSVFTSLYEYADLINSTVLDTDAALRMNQIPVDMANRFRAAPALLAASLVLPAFVM